MQSTNKEYFQDIVFKQDKFENIWLTTVRPLEMPQQSVIKTINDFITKKLDITPILRIIGII